MGFEVLGTTNVELFFCNRIFGKPMEQQHRSSPSAVYVHAAVVHQPRQVRIFDTGRLWRYICSTALPGRAI